MADKTKYYYLKIKENFFDTEDMKLLESMENGYLYSNILMKMYLLSLKHGGELIYKERIPYNSKMLATVLNHNIDIVEKAIKIFESLGLIEILDSGAIFMSDIQNYIGKSSDEADRIRQYRNKINSKKQEMLQMYDKCTTNFANIKDKDIIRDKDINIIKENTKRKKFIKPTPEEIHQYCLERNNFVNWQQFYDFYESKGWKVGNQPMKDWKACVRTWERKDKKQEQNVPEWFDKKIEKEKISAQKSQELEDLIKKYK